MITYYVEDENNKIVLYNENLAKVQNTLLCMPQYQNLEIKETNRPIVNFEFADTYEYIEKQIQKRTDEFHKDFFNTSLGWIRRKVYMKETGETKDFLTGLLPTIAISLILGKTANIITYKEPDFTQEVIDWESLQQIKQANMAFVYECANQTDTDFTGIIHQLVENVPNNENQNGDVFSYEPIETEEEPIEE